MNAILFANEFSSLLQRSFACSFTICKLRGSFRVAPPRKSIGCEYIKRKGFTLLEVIVAIGILSIIGMFVAEKWTSLDVVNLDLQARALAQDIQLTQFLAMTSGDQWNRIQFTQTGYTINSRLNAASRPPAYPRSIVFPQGIQLTSSVADVIFDGLGRPFSDVNRTRPLTVSALYVLSYPGSGSINITVSPETGTVKVG